jgi:hypothetical protein
VIGRGKAGRLFGRLPLVPGLVLAILIAMPPPDASAQSSEPRFSVLAGIRWTGGTNVGTRDANETTASGGTYRLFASQSELASTAAIEAGFGVRLARLLRAEMVVSVGQMDLHTRISSDVEGIPDVEASETIDELTLQGSAVVDLAAWQLPRRTMPYIAAGGGYMRHLHEGRMLAETGSTFHAGGGLRVPLTASAALRFDARAEIRNGGAIPGDSPRVSPSLASSFVWIF